jgi:hypothetical protein
MVPAILLVETEARLATAESCTDGLIAAVLTATAGASNSERRVLPGDRAGIQAVTVAHAFPMIRAPV